MRNSPNYGVRPRGGVLNDTGNLSYIRYRAHPANSDTTLAVESNVGLASTITIPGTTTGIGATAGWFTPDPTAGNVILDQTNAANEVVRCDNLTAANAMVIVLFRIYATTNPTTNECVVGWNNWQAATADGVGLKLSTAGRMECSLLLNNLGGGLTHGTVGQLTDSADHYVLWYVERRSGATPIQGCYIDSSSDSDTKVHDDEDGGNNTGPTTQGLSVFHARNGAGAATNELGTNGSGVRVSDLWLLRTTVDVRGKLGTLIDQYAKAPLEVPPILGEF